ncbi:hypothetical protein CPB83DRAFT_853961 [Crepidotus variabilis]|uniref:Uncharacterized protein n=1 Tax=Crepidotus variabilis TaxID=179855 RepID=A0A9P6JPK6_9AGAR|nr:hypothetical protein CPB83DRAFT_853961 [Crepidotus variabilis]
MMMSPGAMNVPRRPPVPNVTTKPLSRRSSSIPTSSRTNFTPTDEEIYLTRQILVSRGLDADAGSLKGERAREVFNRSALPFPTLRDIWSIADDDGSGDLTRDEIVMALRLIGWVQAGEKLSEELLMKVGPLPTLDGITDVQYSKPRRVNSVDISAKPPTPPVAPPEVVSEGIPSISLFPAVNQDDVHQFRAMFAQAGPINGLLAQDKVMNVYMTSNQSYEDLRKIIHAVSRRTIQMLDFAEFACGLYVLKALQSSQLHSVPSTIPPDIYDQFTLKEALISSSHHNQSPLSASPGYSPASTSSVPEPSPIQLMAAVASQLPSGRQSVPPNFFGHRSTSSLQLPQRGVQTPGPTSPASNRLSTVIPIMTSQREASPANSDWDIPIRDRNTYELYFYKLDDAGSGCIDREAFEEFVKVYRVGKENLDQIWNLTDSSSSNQMQREGFVVALHLVKQYSQGHTIPSVLPLSLIPPSLRGEAMSMSSTPEPSTSLIPSTPPLPPIPARPRTDSESFSSPSSSPNVGKKPPPVPPKKGGSISYKKPPSPVVASSSLGSGKPMVPIPDVISPTSTPSISPNVPPKHHQSKPNLKQSVSSSPSVPSISEVEGDTHPQEEVLVSSPFEDPAFEQSFADYTNKAQRAGPTSRRQSSGSGSGSGSSDTTSRQLDQHRQSFPPLVPPLPSHYTNGSHSTSPTYYPPHQSPSPSHISTSSNHEAFEEFKEEIARLGRQVDGLLNQLSSQNTIRDHNDALRIENEILKSQVKDTEKMMNEVLASSLQQEASRSGAAAEAEAEHHSQSAEEIWRLMAEISTKETKIEDLEKRVQGLSREEKELRDSLREMDTQNTKSKADVVELERKAEGKDAEIAEMKKRLAELERAMMDEVVNANSGGVSGSGSGGASGSGSGMSFGRNKSVKPNANGDDPSVKELKVLIRDVTKENEDLKGQLRDMQRSMEQMLMSGSRSMVEETERENRRLKVQVSELEGMIGQIQESMGGGSSRRTAEEVNQMKTQLQDVQRAFTDYRTTNETRTEDMQQRIESLTTENNRLKIEIHEAGERERRRGVASGPHERGEEENVPPPAYDESFDVNAV